MLRRAAARSFQQVLSGQIAQNSAQGTIVQRWLAPSASFNGRHMSSLPPHTELGMPALSPTMSQGNIASWQVKEGDEVTAGDVLCDVETDKATMAWENQDDGFVAKILKPEGSRDIPVGTAVLILVDDEEHVKAFADYQPGEQPSSQQLAPEAAQPETLPQKGDTEPAATHTQASSVMGPAARLLLVESGLSADHIEPSGPGGIITKGDVLQAISAGKKPSKQPAASSKSQQQQQQQQQPVEKPSKQTEPPARQAAEKEQPAASGPGRPRIRDANIKAALAAQMLERGEAIPAQWLKDWIGYRQQASQSQ